MSLKNALTATLQREPTHLVRCHFYLYVSGEQIIVVEFVPAKQVCSPPNLPAAHQDCHRGPD
jgi:hypothetical protein